MPAVAQMICQGGGADSGGLASSSGPREDRCPCGGVRQVVRIVRHAGGATSPSVDELEPECSGRARDETLTPTRKEHWTEEPPRADTGQAMSQENIRARRVDLTPLPTDSLDALREGYSVWSEGGPAAMQDRWHPSIAWHDPPDFPDSTVCRGAEAVARHLSVRLEALGRADLTVKNGWWVREGETFLVELVLHSGGQSSGVALDVPLFHLIRLSDGKPIEIWEYMRRHQALEALGLRE